APARCASSGRSRRGGSVPCGCGSRPRPACRLEAERPWRATRARVVLLRSRELRRRAGPRGLWSFAWLPCSVHLRQQDEEPDDVRREERLHAVAATIIAGLAHTTMVGEERLRASLGERVKLGQARLKLAERLRDRALAHVRRWVEDGNRRQERERVGPFERAR